MATSAVRTTERTVASAATEVIATADPKRIALGFSLKQGEATSARFWPGADVQWYGWSLTVAENPLWLDLFTFGPLVTLAWYIHPADATILQVIEVYRLQ